MNFKSVNFSNCLFSGIVILAVLAVAFFSCNRFILKSDYVVSYEGVCDPSFESCFVGCEDDECTQEYYYTEVQKYAPDLYRECGKDITDCDVANICLPEDKDCSVTYCDPETNEDGTCSEPSDVNILDGDTEQEFNEEDTLEDNTINKNI